MSQKSKSAWPYKGRYDDSIDDAIPLPEGTPVETIYGSAVVVKTLKKSYLVDFLPPTRTAYNYERGRGLVWPSEIRFSFVLECHRAMEGE